MTINMAFEIIRGSTFHLEWLNPNTGTRERFSTGLKTTNAADRREFAALLAEYTAKEKRALVAVPSRKSVAQWDAWVPAWRDEHYRNKPKSRDRFDTAWRTLRIYLEEQGVDTPRKLTRDHCRNYIAWRLPPDGATEAESAAFHSANRKKDVYAASRNTAILELKMLGTVMSEAVHRGMAQGNPAQRLGLSRDDPNKPDEFSDAILEEIESGIAREPEPIKTILERSYLIARYHGVRLNETRVNPMRDVELLIEGGNITFHQKGGRKRVKPLHPRLFMLFLELWQSRATETFNPPVNFSGLWLKFLDRIGVRAKLHKACFHSFRVTAQNRLRRAGVNEEIRMRYLSHENKGVHAGYSRIQIEEMKICHPHL